MHSNGYILALYTNRQGNKVTIRQYGTAIHVEVAATQQTSLRALSAQCKAARKRYNQRQQALVSQSGTHGPNHESLTNVYA
jgi:hypothetical protein